MSQESALSLIGDSMPVASHPVRRVACILFSVLFIFISPVGAQSERKVTQLADKVYLIEHGDRADGYDSGNTTVIIGQVLVDDAGFLPSVVREDIAQIRQWTDKPVSFLINTHFHNDHNLGNSTYLDQFPGLTIVAHAETRRDMDILGPGTVAIMERSNTRLQRFLDNGKRDDGRVLAPHGRQADRTPRCARCRRAR